MALAVAVACVQALPAQEKREPVDLDGSGNDGSSVISTVGKRAPIMPPVGYFMAEGESENAEATPKM
ncbi:hypothetical protein BV22DRAFT_1133250 [Leucogyrophana mollusca]|uniref:Uncharacterized protein n=1 Tax=Leucogyrophana mollusca TaxID=85980 RepID=A0ACB8B4M6_9AGAM|nr:hypothetical protein BV22DRAFT_1133250 [Leucogyrophana mollusca]